MSNQLTYSIKSIAIKQGPIIDPVKVSPKKSLIPL